MPTPHLPMTMNATPRQEEGVTAPSQQIGGIVVSAGIDEARRNNEPVGIDGALRAFRHFSDFSDFAVGDRDVSLEARRARTVDHDAVS